jgi:hypothetical protein
MTSDKDRDSPQQPEVTEGRHTSQIGKYTSPTPDSITGNNTFERTSEPDTVPLHPALARVAVNYQRIRGDAARGLITTDVAAERLSALVARDDHGVMWTINPADGGWMFLNQYKAWESGQPPVSGVATATSYTLDRAAGQGARWENPDHSVTWTDAEPTGSEWEGKLINKKEEFAWKRPKWLYPTLMLFGMIGLLIFFILPKVTSDTEPTPPPDDIIVTTTISSFPTPFGTEQ